MRVSDVNKPGAALPVDGSNGQNFKRWSAAAAADVQECPELRLRCVQNGASTARVSDDVTSPCFGDFVHVTKSAGPCWHG